MRVNEYLASLPERQFSHADCKLKSAIVNLVKEEMPELWKAALLKYPEPLAIFHELPVGNVWIPEVPYNALLLALAEMGQWDDADLHEGGRAIMARINNSALYGFMLRLLSTKMMLNGATSRWSQVHAGTQLKVIKGANASELELHFTFPENLYRAPHAVFYQGVFQAVLNDARDQGVIGAGTVTSTSIIWPAHLG